MRLRNSFLATCCVAVLAFITGALALMSAANHKGFTKFDKAYYASPETVAFVRPASCSKTV